MAYLAALCASRFESRITATQRPNPADMRDPPAHFSTQAQLKIGIHILPPMPLGGFTSHQCERPLGDLGNFDNTAVVCFHCLTTSLSDRALDRNVGLLYTRQINFHVRGLKGQDWCPGSTMYYVSASFFSSLLLVILCCELHHSTTNHLTAAVLLST